MRTRASASGRPRSRTCTRVPSGNVTNRDGTPAYFASRLAREMSGSSTYKKPPASSRKRKSPAPIKNFRMALNIITAQPRIVHATFPFEASNGSRLAKVPTQLRAFIRFDHRVCGRLNARCVTGKSSEGDLRNSRRIVVASGAQERCVPERSQHQYTTKFKEF